MLKVNQLFDLTNQVWRYNVTSNLIGQIKQLVNYNSLLDQWKRLYNWIQSISTAIKFADLKKNNILNWF